MYYVPNIPNTMYHVQHTMLYTIYNMLSFCGLLGVASVRCAWRPGSYCFVVVTTGVVAALLAPKDTPGWDEPPQQNDPFLSSEPILTQGP